MGKKAVVTRTETTSGDEDEGGQPNLSEVALFADRLAEHGGDEAKRIVRIDVSREDPEEGFLGTVKDLTLSESQVFERWGGGKFVFFAKNSMGQVVTRKTLPIAGEPVFQSEVAEMRYRRANGLKPKKHEAETADGAYTAKELMAIIEAKAEAARADAETREEKRRREDAEREEKLRREEREWRERLEREKAEREERNRREEREHAARLETQRREDEKAREARIREDEARREKDHERQMQAAALAAKESQEKSQQFFTNMLAMAKTEKKEVSDPMAQVTQILTIVEALKGAGSGEPQDAVTALLSRLPETLQAAGGMVGNAIREAKGLPAKPGEQGGGDDEGGEMEPGAIKLTGAAAAKVKELVTHLISKGQDPEKVLVAAADYLMGKRPNAAVAAAQAVEQKRRDAVGRKPPPGNPARRKAKSVQRQAAPQQQQGQVRPHNPTASPVARGPAPAARPAGAPPAKPPGAP